MSSIEKDFLARALGLGLAETIARTIQDLDRVIAEYPARGGERYLKRLHEQRRSLVAPSLRTIAALVVSMCAQDRLRARLIAPTFALLAAQRPDMARFYEHLNAAGGVFVDQPADVVAQSDVTALRVDAA
uniref:Uncharacterized protein n=1 Tax=Caulobacter sp. (strain K31) TaxID=366602 RepID=B0T6V3_CAUSK